MWTQSLGLLVDSGALPGRLKLWRPAMSICIVAILKACQFDFAGDTMLLVLVEEAAPAFKSTSISLAVTTSERAEYSAAKCCKGLPSKGCHQEAPYAPLDKSITKASSNSSSSLQQQRKIGQSGYVMICVQLCT